MKIGISFGRVLAIAILTGYWVVIFRGTHAPLPRALRVGSLDKLAHFFAYAGLGLLRLG
jgi:hypothetical protein